MYCPNCRTEYRKGFTTCADCEVPLVAYLPPAPPAPQEPDYVKYVHLYSPLNGIELMLLRSILDSERINYYVRNDNFGSLEVGPYIGLFNAKMIEVQDDQYEQARELLADYFEKTSKEKDEPTKSFSLFDKIRMVIEVFVFGWLMPGRARTKKID